MATKFEVIAREALVQAMIKMAEENGWAVERVNDLATVAIEVVAGDEARWMTVKAVAPKLADKDGNELWTIDEAMQGYEDRIAKDKEKAEAKAEKERISAEKKAKAAADKAAKEAAKAAKSAQ